MNSLLDRNIKVKSGVLVVASGQPAGIHEDDFELDTNYDRCIGLRAQVISSGGLSNLRSYGLKDNDGVILDFVNYNLFTSSYSGPNEKFLDVNFPIKSGQNLKLRTETPGVTSSEFKVVFDALLIKDDIPIEKKSRVKYQKKLCTIPDGSAANTYEFPFELDSEYDRCTGLWVYEFDSGGLSGARYIGLKDTNGRILDLAGHELLENNAVEPNKKFLNVDFKIIKGQGLTIMKKTTSAVSGSDYQLLFHARIEKDS